MRSDVSAIYVMSDGPYRARLEDCWDEERDARGYIGPNPVVAHPPCKRWGRWWYADGSERPGNDGGLFNHALGCVMTWGGVLEHPAASHAWAAHGLRRPINGEWIHAMEHPRKHGTLWTTQVPQRNYGHKARKLTWLLYFGDTPPPPLDWSPPKKQTHYLCPPGRKKGTRGDTSVKLLTRRENAETPGPFADLLISLASRSRSAKRSAAIADVLARKVAAAMVEKMQ
jgi:hypothetical protein